MNVYPVMFTEKIPAASWKRREVSTTRSQLLVYPARGALVPWLGSSRASGFRTIGTPGGRYLAAPPPPQQQKQEARIERVHRASVSYAREHDRMHCSTDTPAETAPMEYCPSQWAAQPRAVKTLIMLPVAPRAGNSV